MIKKIVKISGTGKFLNYNHNTPPTGFRTTDFERINLIYGENGSGKTTLSIILRSLKGNNPLLPRVRSFDRTIPQIIEILTDFTSNPLLTYNNSSWNNHYPNIEIFDTHFINENIYTGLEILTNHKKNLFEVIFGQQGVQLKTDIQLIKDRIQTGNKFIKETTEKIQLAINNTFTASSYCNILIDPLIDSKITSKESEILTAKSYQEIQSKPALITLPLLSVPFELTSTSELLSKSIDSISEEYLEKVSEHKKHLSMNGKEEDWLKQGYNAITDNSCPFCLRPFDNSVDVLEAYKQYFNDEYNDLLASLSKLMKEIEKCNLEAQLLQIETNISSNLLLIDFWKNHTAGSPVLESIISFKEDLLTGFKNAKNSIENKSKNPIHESLPDEVIAFLSKVETVNTKITGFNALIFEFNSKISILKTSTQPNVNTLETDLKKLNAIKKRSDVTISKLCTDLTTYTNSVGNLNTQKTTKQQQLDAFTTSIFVSYSTRINHYLQSFAPYLEIRNLDSGYVGSSKEPLIKYALHINGNEIKQEDSLSSPCFKFSFSEGDKSALALSFFLTKIEVDGNIQDKIIVFDDPVSSFDLNRKSTTISNLLNLGQQAKQLFILTHNIIFANEFWKNANQTPINTQCSKIEYLGNTACIVEYNIETETLSSILKDSLAIKNHLINGSITDHDKRAIARCLRPALESYFHLKYFDLVSPNDWLGDFISKVRNSASGDPFFRLHGNLDELSDINDYSKKYHHRFNANNENEPVTDAELRTYCKRTLDLIQVI